MFSPMSQSLFFHTKYTPIQAIFYPMLNKGTNFDEAAIFLSHTSIQIQSIDYLIRKIACFVIIIMSDQFQKKGKKLIIPEDEEQDFQEIRDTQTIKKKFLPQVLLQTIPFDKENEELKFYREYKKLGEKNGMIINHGWRIAEISGQQEDLVLYCFSLFQSQVKFPLSFWITKQAIKSQDISIKRYSKFLWMEASILISAVSRGDLQDNIEFSYYSFIKEKIISIIVNFIAHHLQWTNILESQDSILVEQFQQAVIDPVNGLFEAYRIGEDYKLNTLMESGPEE